MITYGETFKIRVKIKKNNSVVNVNNFMNNASAKIENKECEKDNIGIMRLSVPPDTAGLSSAQVLLKPGVLRNHIKLYNFI
jgi:hypothetical protein